MTDITPELLREQISNLTPYEFEQFVADLWDARGWETTVTTESNDRGIDIIATRQRPFSERQLIQVKQYSKENPVSSPEVQQYSSLKHQENNVDSVIIVTSSRLSKQAKEVAEKLNVKIVNFDALYKLIVENNLEYIAEKHTNATFSERAEPSTSNSALSSQTHKTGSSKKYAKYIPIAWGAVAVIVLVMGFSLSIIGTQPLSTQHNTIGDSIIYNNLQIEVTTYKTATKPIAIDPFPSENISEPPEQGAKFVLIHLRVENVGEMEQEYPDDVKLVNKDTDMGQVSTYGNFSLGGKEHVSYKQMYGQSGAYAGAYNGVVVSGWTVFEVPRSFEPRHATVELTLGERSSDVDTRTLVWNLETDTSN